jgi:RNA polymerase sigma-70 factor (ECF subfamily)
MKNAPGDDEHPVLGNRFEETLDAARAGAEWAWVSIYRELAPSVIGYLRGRGVRDPDDLAGEVFLQVVRDLAGFDGNEREFRAWVFAIAHHRMLDDWRRAGRRPVEVGYDRTPEDGAVENAEESALRRVAADRVLRILGELTHEQQEVLLLRLLGDLTVDEVARVIGKSSGAVKALQRRGLEAARLALSEGGVPTTADSALT